MIKHIVMWKLADEAGGQTKQQNAEKIKVIAEALNDKIEGMNWLEIGIDFSKSEGSFDVALYSEFDSVEALNNYKVHPEHVKLAEFVHSVITDRKVVDYNG